MNDDLQSFIEPEMEARLVALVLEEVSAFEAGELEKLMAEQPELAAFKARIEAVHGVVREGCEEGDSEEWKLSGERRENVLSKYRTAESAERAKKLERRIEKSARRSQKNLIYGVAACLVVTLVLAGMLVPLGTKASHSVKSESFVAEEISPEAMLAELDEKLMKQSDLVQDHRKDLTVLLQQYGIPYFDGGESSPLGMTEEELFRNSRQRLADFETQRDATEKQLQGLEGKDGDDLVAYAAGLDVPENQVTEYLAKHREATAEKKALMAKGVGSTDPSFVAAEERAKRAMAAAGEEAESLKSVSKTKLELLDRQVDRMSEMVDSRQDDTVALSLRQNSYNQAKETYEQSRNKLRKMEIAQEEVRRSMESEPDGQGRKTREAAATALAKLDEQIAGERGRVDERRKDLRGIIQEQDVPYMDGEGSLLPGASESAAKKAQVSTALASLDDALSLAEQPIDLQRNEPLLKRRLSAVQSDFDAERDPAAAGTWGADREGFSLSDESGVDDDIGVDRYAWAAFGDFKSKNQVAEKAPAPSLRDSGVAGEFEEADMAGSLQFQWKTNSEEDDSGLWFGKNGENQKQKTRPGVTGGLGIPDLDEIPMTGRLFSRRRDETRGEDRNDGYYYRWSAPSDSGFFEDQAEGAVAGKAQWDDEADFKKFGEMSKDRIVRREVAFELGVGDFGSVVENEGGQNSPGASIAGEQDEGSETNRNFSEGKSEMLALKGLASGTLTNQRDGGGKKNLSAFLSEGNERRKVMNNHLADGAVALSQQHRRKGRYEEARDLLTEVDQMDPQNEVVEKELEYLDDPIRANPALTYDGTKNVDKIRRGLYKGEGLYDLGLYDKAEEEFKEILRTDPHNKAARRWLGRTDSIKSDYYRAAYDQTRAEMLMEVDREWELAVPGIDGKPGSDATGLNEVDSEGLDSLSLYSVSGNEGVGERSITSKGNQIIFPEVDFNNTTVEEALDFVRLRAAELDNTTLDESQKGVNLVLDDAALLGRVLPKMKLVDVPLRIVLEKIGAAIGTSVEFEDFAIRLSKDERSDVFEASADDNSVVQSLAKLNQIILPEIRLSNASLSETIEFLNVRSKELDNTTLDEAQKGLEIVIEDPLLERRLIEGRRITQLKLMNVPLRSAVEEVARMAGCKVRFDGGKLILFSDPNEQAIVVLGGFETLTSEKSDSTFSLNVSDVSFKLAKAALAEGRWPDAAKVRAEEFVNALGYDDAKPSQSEKVACAIEQGAHPFMQQRNLMRIAMSTASLGRTATTPLRLTILLDQSGSMERADRAESVKRALALLAAQLNANDEVTLIGFARTPRLLAERVKGDEAGKLAEIVANPLTEGGTNLEEALSLGLKMAKQQFVESAQNRIILVTDGAANLGDALPENLARQVESMRAQEIAFDACGVGADGLNDEILSALAKQGDGRYYFLDRPEDADEGFARQIAGALRPAAKNVKVQILFNPERVSKFKLYGFEKHKLKKEDFRNDAVDAAEMAAEESGVALYHFEPLAEGEGDIGTVSVRFLDTATGQMVERTWAIPYLPETPLFAEAKPSLRLAGVAGLFAEKLKGSPVGERVELKRLRQEAEQLKSTYQLQPRFQNLQTMLQQAGE